MRNLLASLLLLCAPVYSATVTLKPESVQVLVDGVPTATIQLNVESIKAPEPVVKPKPVTAPAIESKLKIDNISVTTTGDSARLKWSILGSGQLVKATGLIEYGLTNKLGTKNLPGEQSFNYATHIQTLKGLKPNTGYYYRITSKDKAGDIGLSDILTFRTKAGTRVAPVRNQSVTTPAPGWPANANESLPMSGIFYGMTHGGLQTGNTTLAIEHSFRFRA